MQVTVALIDQRHRLLATSLVSSPTDDDGADDGADDGDHEDDNHGDHDDDDHDVDIEAAANDEGEEGKGSPGEN